MPGDPPLPDQWIADLAAACSLGSTGHSRAPSPKRKMAAAMRPIDTPHSKIDGMYGSGANCGLGDEEWVIQLPPRQFLQRYAFFTDPTYAATNLVITRVAGPSGFSDVDVACLGTVTGWQPVGSGGKYEVAYVDLYRTFMGSPASCATSSARASCTTSSPASATTSWRACGRRSTRTWSASA